MTTTWRSSLLLFAAAALLAACSPEAPKFRSTDITGADFGKELALTGHDGKPRTLADFRGKVVVLFFGYTHCPDICPTTLADMAAVMKQLGPDAARVQVLFVTVDPERDTPEILAKLRAGIRFELPRAVRRCRGDAARGEGVQDLLRKAAGRRAGRLHRGSQRDRATCSMRRADCACSCATTASRRTSPRTCARLLKEKA